MLTICLSIFLIILLIMGFWSQQAISNETDYLVAGRRLPLVLAFGTLVATWFGAGSVLGASNSAYEEGFSGVILDPFASGLALIVAGVFFARRLWNMEILTTGDLYRIKYGPNTEFISSIIQAAGYLPWIAGQYLALAQVQSIVFGIPNEYGIVLGAVFCLLLTLTGGMWSVTITDTAQLVIMFIGLLIVFIDIMFHLGNGSFAQGVTNFIDKTDPDLLSIMPELTAVATLAWASTWATGVFGNIPGQDLMQRVFASKSGRVAAQACILGGCIYIVFGLIPVILGIVSRDFVQPPQDGESVLLEFVKLRSSQIMVTMFTISLTACIISTCTSATLSPASLIGRNLLGRLPLFREQGLLVNRIGVVIVTIMSIPFAFYATSILDLLDQSLGIALVGLFIPFAFGAYLSKRPDHAGVISVLSGTIVWLIHLVLTYQFPMPEDPKVPVSSAIEWLNTIPPEFTGLAACAVAFLIFARKPHLDSPVQPEPSQL